MRLKLFSSLALAAAVVIGAASAAPARADIVVNVNQGVTQPLPIAIAPFTSPSSVGGDIATVVSNDLDSSGLFRALDPNGFIDRNLNVNLIPRFDNWKTLGAQALVDGAVTVDADGRLRVDFRLWDVNTGQQLAGTQFVAAAESWRRVGHKIADLIYTRLTGEGPYFDTQIVFVAESGPRSHRIKHLGIMDQDGANPSLLNPNSDAIIMTPRYSSTSLEIPYMALKETGSNIYLFNLDTGRQETLGHFSGLVFAPRFSPDGNKVVFSQERGGNSDVYVMDLRSRQVTRLTTDPAIDTSPSFSPDGSKITFNSDRSGAPELYVMNADGSGVHRISFGSGRYTTPVWSPRGDFIAFTKQTGNEFHIGVMRPDGSDERILTTSYLDEGPTWAPNGRMLMFFREPVGSQARLWTVDLTGRIIHQVAYSGSASDPAWSPLLN